MAGSSKRSHFERPSEPAGRAKLLLGIDPRTARKHIRNFVENRPGPKLEGFIIPGAKKDGYRFYTEHGGPAGPRPPSDLLSETEQLRAQLAAALEANAQLQVRATEAEMRADEADDARRELLAAQDIFFESTEQIHAGAENLQNGAKGYFEMLKIYRGQLARHLSPDDLRHLPQI